MLERMPDLIESPARVEAAGNLPKVIEEFVGRVITGTGAVSIARMTSWLPAFSPDTVHRDA